MSPEQKKARKLIDRHRKDMWHDDHAAELCAAIARALRAERNAALERAAKCCPPNWIGPGGNEAAALIRSLKSRAPKRRTSR